METKLLTMHVPLPLAERVDALASRMNLSRGSIVKQALWAWVKQEEERRRRTLEAMADVQSGDVVDHQDVRAWADSLGTEEPLSLPR